MTANARGVFRALTGALLLLGLTLPAASRAAAPNPGTPLTIQRAPGAITLDGDLSDAGWQGITPITTWYETNVGDNAEPQVKNVAWLAYDDQYFYAAFQFDDPHPEGIRAPIGDHDAMPGSTDYAGIIVDSRNDGKTAQMFLANMRGVQYDAVSSDATGEDNAPDWFWDAMGKVTPTGWNLEIRVPFSSLRYTNVGQPTWGILLYRNYPRERRFQFFSARLPRDVNCFICNSSKLVGLTALPKGSHLVVAPFATTTSSSEPRGDLGTPLEEGPLRGDAGLDLKWSPASSVAIDATVNPDFSQVESDVAQIAANERFALFFPEKRPFFLEGVDLLAAPMQAVYTRTVTSPRSGLRATGKVGSTAYTALVTQDRGGGLVILPGPQSSDFARQDFVSEVAVARIRHDLGRSFVSLLATGRLIESGGGNLVVGPDFQWRPRGSDSFTGQALVSQSHTPERTDLAAEWNGQVLTDRALFGSWSHGTPRVDWYFQGLDVGPDFRADDGFITQVGYREGYTEFGSTFRPKKSFLSRIRLFAINWIDVEPDNDELFRRHSAGVGMDGRWNSFLRVELNRDNIRVGNTTLQRFRPRVQITASPSLLVNQLSVDTYLGEEIDFANGREGSGATIVSSATVRPTDHLELRGNFNVRWVDVSPTPDRSGRLFTAHIERLRATYSFNARTFLRVIGQIDQTRRDTSLYTYAEIPKEVTVSSSALFAYKLNWQTVGYLGYGDVRLFDEVSDSIQKYSRQVFLKISYAWQH